MSHPYGYGEVIPLVPALPAAGEGLAALFPLLLWGLALALLVIWRHTFGALFTHLAHLFDRVSVPTPFGAKHPLGFVSSGLRTVDYAVQHILAVSADATERAAVYLFHKSLATFRAVGQEMYRLSEDMVRALQLLERHRIPRLIATALIPPLAVIAALKTSVRVLEHTLVRPLTSRVGRLEHTVERDFGIARRGIDVTRRDLARAEKDVVRLGSRVDSLTRRFGAAAFAGAVAVALGTLGLSFLRCPSFMRIGRRIGCGGFGLLEDLLFGAVEGFAVADLCLFAGLVTAAAEEIRPLLMDFVDVEEALVGCHGATAPARLSIPRIVLPPTNAGLPLAA